MIAPGGISKDKKNKDVPKKVGKKEKVVQGEGKKSNEGEGV